MAMPSDIGRRGASQENLLLDYVRRLERHRQGRGALLIRLSGLRPFNRREHHVRAAADSFEPLVKSLQGQIFVLADSDLFFVFKLEATRDVEVAVQKIRFLFSDDPLLADEGAGRDGFCTWYDVEKQFDQIQEFAQKAAADVKDGGDDAQARLDTRAALKARQEHGSPLTPEVLSRVEEALSRADISNLVRRQFVCGVTPKGIPEPAFSELFISIQDLRETLLPGVNLASSRWLFMHMTSSLDKRMLAMLAKSDQMTLSGDISFNLNVATLLTPDFLNFDDNIPAARRGAMVLEINAVDAFSDLGAYLFARNFAQNRGYRICIDGLTHQSMQVVDRERLGADFVKLVWDPDMADGGEEMREKVGSLVKRAGPSRVVLCRCDARESVDYGRSVGIRFFQGRQVENLIAEDNRRRELLRLKRRIERG